MEKIYVLCPENQREYLYMLTEVTPRLDAGGISFHVAQPAEDIADFILHSEGRKP